MLMFDKQFGDIFNLDNIVRIWADDKGDISCADCVGNRRTMIEIADKDLAKKVVKKIYEKMTYGSGNMIIDLEEFKEEADECTTES